MPEFWLYLNNGFMMIKHQVELVNVVNTDCPLHGAVIDGVEIENRLNKEEEPKTDDISHLPKHYFDDNAIKSETICLCDEKVVSNQTTVNKEHLYNVDF